MDPLSYLLSAYLNIVQSTLHQHVVDSTGMAPKALEIAYRGQNIPFQYQGWKIRANSVCAPYVQDTLAYSQCTIAAKALFEELCTALSKSDNPHPRHVSHQHMYCNAAVSYTPTVATIFAAETPSALAAAKAACNTAIAAAMGSDDVALVQQREKACGEYRVLRE